MAVWAYVCHSCEGDPPATWYVAAAELAAMPPGARIVRVKVGANWRCAVVDREQKVSIDGMLARDVIASSADDCPACRERLAGQTRSAAAVVGAQAGGPVEQEAAPGRAASSSPRAPSRTVQAAAIALTGRRLVVVLVSMDLVRNVGEADLAIETLVPDFGGVPVVLMAQEDDGSPRYYGEAELVDLLDGLPIERMPWKEYPVG
jgi:hypothetical protein